METLPGVESSPKIPRSTTATFNAATRSTESSDSDSDSENPKGETFLTRYNEVCFIYSTEYVVLPPEPWETTDFPLLFSLFLCIS